MPTPSTTCFDDLLARWAPATVLAVGPKATQLLSAYASAHPTCQISYIASDGCVASALEALCHQPRYEFALIAGLLETEDLSGCVTLIARLRDVYSQRLCVFIETTSTSVPGAWSHSDFVALGLQPLFEGDSLRVYGFDINAYKDTPDWLNAGNWANPGLWNKHRW